LIDKRRKDVDAARQNREIICASREVRGARRYDETVRSLSGDNVANDLTCVIDSLSRAWTCKTQILKRGP
jgi:hypothetical protein